MSCARGYIARNGKGKGKGKTERKEIGEILWIYGEGKDRTVEEMDPYDKLKSKFPARAAATTRCAHHGYRLTVCP